MTARSRNSPDLSDQAAECLAGAWGDVPERVRQIAMRRGSGYSYRQIAEPLSVSPQGISLMLTGIGAR